MYCWGCRLTQRMNGEPDHYKDLKNGIINRWLRNHDNTFNHDDLPKAIADFPDRDIARDGRRLESRRAKELRDLGYDREFEEKQIPIHRSTLMSKRGGHTRSMMIHEWAQEKRQRHLECTDPVAAGWSYSNMKRYHMHAPTQALC